MPKAYSMVRLETKTHARLIALRERMELAAINGQATYHLGHLDQITLDTVLNLLLDRDEAHKARKRESAAKRSSSRKAKSVYTVIAVEEGFGTEGSPATGV